MSNSKKQDTYDSSDWADKMSDKGSKNSSKHSNANDSGSDENDDKRTSIIRGLARAVTNDLKTTMKMAPGGAFTAESIEWVKQSLHAVIQEQCELLYNPANEAHKELCYEIACEVKKVTSKFEENLDWNWFEEEMTRLMENSAELLHENKSSPSSKSSDTSSIKSSKQKEKKAQAEKQRQPAGPDRPAFGLG